MIGPVGQHTQGCRSQGQGESGGCCELRALVRCWILTAGSEPLRDLARRGGGGGGGGALPLPSEGIRRKLGDMDAKN